MTEQPGGVERMLATARARLRRVAPADLAAEMASGSLVVDIRPVEARTVEGELPGAVVVDRNVLEWRLDPSSAHRIAEATGPDVRVVVVCNEGYQSTLAAAALQDIGLPQATDLVGGYRAWRALASPGPLGERETGSLDRSAGPGPVATGLPAATGASGSPDRLPSAGSVATGAGATGADLARRREQYGQRGLRRSDLAADPFSQFEAWLGEWTATDPYDPTAVVLATADAAGRPSARYVLLKGLDQGGFVFYTNTASRKGADLAANPAAALCFGWITLERQVRVEGTVQAVPDRDADQYWASRPRGSQLGAWASDQSTPVADRSTLESRLAEVTRRFEGVEVPRPTNWGGYRLDPGAVEFWQGRRDRLHDRLRYTRDPGVPAGWRIDRLSP